jgi:hypothetical protein
MNVMAPPLRASVKIDEVVKTQNLPQVKVRIGRRTESTEVTSLKTKINEAMPQTHETSQNLKNRSPRRREEREGNPEAKIS